MLNLRLQSLLLNTYIIFTNNLLRRPYFNMEVFIYNSYSIMKKKV